MMVTNKNFYRIIKYSLSFVVGFFFVCCKKKEKTEVIVDTVSPVYNIFCNASFELLLNSNSSYDTLTTFSLSANKYYPVQNKYDYYPNVDAVCNGFKPFEGVNNPGNKLQEFYPTCIYKISSPYFSDINYNDTMTFPKNIDPQWWVFDSVPLNQDLTIDLSSFKNFDVIFVSIAPDISHYYSYNIPFPGNSLTIKKEVFMYSDPQVTKKNTLKIRATKLNNIEFDNIKCEFSKSIYLEIPIKFY